MDLDQTIVDFIQGLLWLLTTIGVVLAIYFSTKNHQRQAKKESDNKFEQIKAQAREETRSEMAFKHLEDAVYNMHTTVSCMNDNLSTRMQALENKQDKFSRSSIYLVSSVRAMHKRLDEHRVVEHGVPKSALRTEDNFEFDEDEVFDDLQGEN